MINAIFVTAILFFWVSVNVSIADEWVVLTNQTFRNTCQRRPVSVRDGQRGVDGEI